ncbi:MAG: DUF2950 domain-containing protein [Reyranellales bacterium]
MSGSILRRGLLALALLGGLAVAAAAQPARQPVPQIAPQSAKLQGFPTAEAAASALTEAIRADDDKAVSAMLGSTWRDLVPRSKEDVERVRAKYLAGWDVSHKVVVTDDKATVEAGTTGWTMPIPIVKEGAEWHFDVEAGRKEIAARRIGRNELAVIQTLLAIVDAQRDYASLDPMKAGVPAYARRLTSTPGKKDGLYWQAAPGEPESPLGPEVAKAQAAMKDAPHEGYFGYHYRLLYGQGAAAHGGAHNYLVNGRMIAGFAVIAWPVHYGDTGVMTFIVNQHGDVYEQDLGADTAQRAQTITLFNPDKDWQKADMAPP